MTGLFTLCYIEKDGKYLMLHRTVKKNDVNKDKWIGVGGQFEADESPEECLLREVREETGYRLTSYHYRGIVTFVSGNGVTEYMSLFTADGFEGEAIPCDEGELEWDRPGAGRSPQGGEPSRHGPYLDRPGEWQGRLGCAFAETKPGEGFQSGLL